MYTITAETGDYTAQSNQRVMMSKSISSPLSASTSGSVFDVMDKTGCHDFIQINRPTEPEEDIIVHYSNSSMYREKNATASTAQSRIQTFRHLCPQ